MDTGLMSIGPLTKKLLQNTHTAQWAIAKNKENVQFPIGPLLKALQKTKNTCTFPSVPYWKLCRKWRTRALSPRSLNESSAENEEHVHFPLGPLLKAQQKMKNMCTFPLGPLLKAPQKMKKTCTFLTVPYWKLRTEQALLAWYTLRRCSVDLCYPVRFCYLPLKQWVVQFNNKIFYRLNYVLLMCTPTTTINLPLQ